METIFDYIKSKYQPLSVIVYGSYADGTHNGHSDFDALAIVQDGEAAHDTQTVNGIQLDLWVYPLGKFQGDFDPEEVLQIFDGRILWDPRGIGAGVQEKVRSYLAAIPLKSREEAEEELRWCRKMLRRCERQDPEGMYRWHWLLTDSLQIACDVLGHRYAGPKKSLRWLEKQYPALYTLYAAALSRFDRKAMEDFLDSLEKHLK